MTKEITQSNLVGAWELIEFTITPPDGTTKNWGHKPHGLLIYDKSGNMSTSINSGVTNRDPGENFKNILFYSGTFKIESPNKILHIITNASDPNRIGKTMIRDAEITDNHLCLRATGEYGNAYLLWKRL